MICSFAVTSIRGCDARGDFAVPSVPCKGGDVHRIVIVGGGMAGLSAAWELLGGAGGPSGEIEVTLLESSDRVGGKLRREEVGGRLVDVGAEAILATRPEAVALLTEIGAHAQIVTPATMAASVFSRGRFHPLPPGTLMGIPGDPGAAAGLLTDAEIERARDERPVAPIHADVSVGDYVGDALGEAIVDRLVDPLLGGVYAGSARGLSLAATLPGVYAAATAGRGLLATAASVAPSPRPAADPASEMSAPAPFIGVRGGVGRLPGLTADAITARGGHIRTHATVTELLPGDGGWEVVATCAEGGVSRHQADAVVLALPAAATRGLLEAHSSAAADALGRIEAASVAVVTFAFETATLPTLTGSGFLVPPIEGHPVKASTFSSAKWGWLAEASPAVTFIRASLGRHGDEADLVLDDGLLARLAFADLCALLGVDLPEPLDVHVQRWDAGLPQYAVGHLTTVSSVDAAMGSVPGVEVAGAAYRGVGIPAVIASGRDAARAVLTTLGLRD